MKALKDINAQQYHLKVERSDHLRRKGEKDQYLLHAPNARGIYKTIRSSTESARRDSSDKQGQPDGMDQTPSPETLRHRGCLEILREDKKKWR